MRGFYQLLTVVRSLPILSHDPFEVESSGPICRKRSCRHSWQLQSYALFFHPLSDYYSFNPFFCLVPLYRLA